MDKAGVIKKICEDFDYTKRELSSWTFTQIDEDPGMFGNVFFNGDYVFFAEDKIVWY